jgi:diguanylate cyclase (GGDEF)-like protein
MRLPFKIKLGLAVTTLTVGLTTASVCHFYYLSQDLVRRQVTGRLRDIGHTSTFLLTNADRETITTLKEKLDRDSQISLAQMQQIKPGEVLNSLGPEKIKAYQSTPEMQQLIQWLRKIKLASLDRIDPLRDYYPQQFTALPDGVLAYIMVEIPEFRDRRVLKFLASADPDPEPPKWPGNPVGEAYVPVSPIFSRAFEGKFQVADDYYTDQFYTCLTAVVPIKDRNGKVVAVLGLDYLAGTEQDYLRKLRSICWSIVGGSVVFSTLLSLLLARYFGALEQKNRQLKDYSEDLEEIVQERTIELQKVNQVLQKLATVDSLTQIYNRRYFDDYLQTEWHRARRACTPIGLILCDIDHFKAYNDTYGHQDGDVCLYRVAQGILQCINRNTDRVARYGGEEFVVVLPNTDLKGVLQVAETIRVHIQGLKLAHGGGPSGVVTLSFGVASMVPKQDSELAQLISTADQGLYLAKDEGRDRVAVYEGEGSLVAVGN